MTAPRVAVVVETYPCRSETFVVRDVARLEAAGIAITIVACRPGRSAGGPRIAADVIYPRRGLVVGVPREAARAATLLRRSPRSVRSAIRAAAIAGAAGRPLARWGVTWVHAHFLGLPAVIGSLLAHRLTVPLSLSAHARDLFVPSVDVAAVCEQARFVAVCSEHARASLLGRLPASAGDRVVSAPHAVPSPSGARRLAGGDALRLLSVCRLVPKKGIDVVLRALALLPELRYRYRVVGDGPERGRLRALADMLGISGAVELVGACEPDAVARELAAADLFVLGCRVAPDGDRDGIPNALVEAMLAGVPALACDAGGVSEVIEPGRTGWLVAPDSAPALAVAIRDAAADPAARARIASAGRAAMHRRFAVGAQPDRLARLLLDSHVTSHDRAISYGCRLAPAV